MSRLIRAVSGLLVLGLCAGLAPAALAQERGLEFGADIGLGFESVGEGDFFTAGTPVSLRVGVPIGERFSIEPRLGFSLLSGEGSSFTTLDLQGAVLARVTGDAQNEGVYVVALPQLSYLDFDVESTTQFAFGGGAGVRFPYDDRMAFRVEAQFVHAFETDELAGSDAILGLFGITFFMR